MAKRSPEERFWEKVNRDGPIPIHRPELGPCWIWLGAKHVKGYGKFSIGTRDLRVHRFAYELLVGPIPEGLEPDHLCRVRACVKAIADERGPAHLEPVTHAENIRRGVGWFKIASLMRSKTHCPQGHPYDEANTYTYPNGDRDCRTCRRQRDVRRARRP